jgi:hypothetical protein
LCFCWLCLKRYESFFVSIIEQWWVILSSNAVDLSGDIPAGQFNANVPATTNAGGAALGVGTDFTIGYANSQVAPGIGEIVSLTSGNGGVVVDISDQFNGRMSTGTAIAVTIGSDGCKITNVPGGTSTDSSALGFTSVFISLATQSPNPPSGSSGVEVKATSFKGLLSGVGFSCSY